MKSKSKKTIKKILLAEDEQILNRIFSSRLEEEGFKVERVFDGGEALAKLSTQSFDLLLLDLLMPVMGGIEVLTELKARKNKIPVIVLTNLSSGKDPHAAMALGAKAWFIKSDMTTDDLVQIVKKHIGR